MSKLVQAAGLAVFGLIVLSATGPTLVRLTSTLVPLVLVVGAVIAVLEVVRYFTRGRF